MSNTKCKLALDWTPNSNHTGFFVSKEVGYYTKNNIELEIVHPGDDGYKKTPMKKLEDGEVDFAICPLESVISYQSKKKPFDCKVIYNVFQEDLSAIVTLKESGIATPAQLDHKVYASYAARYEDYIVQELIKNDGGSGEIELIYPNKLGIWNTLKEGKADATWIFRNWEGLDAAYKGIELNEFKLNDYQIPYGFSPVVVASQKLINENPELVVAFGNATLEGFLHSQNHLSPTARLMEGFVPKEDLKNFTMLEAQLYTNPFYGKPIELGTVNHSKLTEYLNWLRTHKIESKLYKPEDLVWNPLLQQ